MIVYRAHGSIPGERRGDPELENLLKLHKELSDRSVSLESERTPVAPFAVGRGRGRRAATAVAATELEYDDRARSA